MNEPTLRIQSLRKVYNLGTPSEIHILKDIDFSVEHAEVVALVAPSGAGKSTLLHIAGLLDTPDEGFVSIAGKNPARIRDREITRMRRQDIGFIYQFHHLLPEFTALENIILPQLANNVHLKEATAYAMSLLERVGVDHRAEHRPAALSGGEQQRIAFCRALANKPKLLLADEPTGNLDPENSTQVFETLLELVKETGLSALIATHNPDLAARMDRTIKLKNGQIS
jgi:lipoprotein-releasing system ATP-binding protein